MDRVRTMKVAWWAAALTYVGAVVGAGFASGQEIYQFFGRFGQAGVWGIVLAGVLFAGLGFLALEHGRLSKSASFGYLLKSLYPPWGVHLAEGMTTAFLVVGLGVVASGGGAVIHQIGGTPDIVGAVVTTGVVLGVAALGTTSVVKANTILIPFLVAMVLGLALILWGEPPAASTVARFPGWAISAVLYLSYNFFTGLMVLLGLGTALPTRRHSALAAIVGALLLSGLAYAEHHTLMRLGTIGALPLVDAAARVGAMWGVGFGVCLWVALFTTGVAEAYALGAQYGRRILWALAPAALFGLFGFEGLVGRLYPVMGLVAIVLWIPLVYRGNRRGRPGG